MNTLKKWISTCLITAALAPTTALATEQAPLNWAFQDTGFLGFNSALAMRNGRALPVIFGGNGFGNINAYALLPVFNPQSNTNWFEIGTDLFNNNGNAGNTAPLRAATSPNGRVAVSGSDSSFNFSAVVSNIPAGFSSFANVRAVAFNSGGGQVTATMDTVSAVGGFPGFGIQAIAVSDFGDIGAVTDNGEYYQFSQITGQWGSDFLPEAYNTDTASVTFDSNGIPHVAAHNGMNPIAFDFDATTGTWTSTTFLDDISSSVLPMTSDSQGTVGTAWVDEGTDTLKYAFKKGLDPWSVVSVTTDVEGLAVGLAYDYNDFPVISYRDLNTGNLFLAYDPPAGADSPEPASAALLLCLACPALLSRRTRSTTAD